VTSDYFQLHTDINCKTKDVINLIACKRCRTQYAGQTTRNVSKRMNSHVYDICNFTEPAFSILVALHFNGTN